MKEIKSMRIFQKEGKTYGDCYPESRPDEPFNYPHNEKWEADLKNEIDQWEASKQTFPVNKVDDDAIFKMLLSPNVNTKELLFTGGVWLPSELISKLEVINGEICLKGEEPIIENWWNGDYHEKLKIDYLLWKNDEIHDGAFSATVHNFLLEYEKLKQKYNLIKK